MNVEVKIPADLEKIFEGFSTRDMNKLLDDMGHKLNIYMVNGGTSTVKDGQTPVGGAPSDTNTLRSAITSDPANNKTKYIRVPNVNYVGYVVDGTSKMPPNNFPKRAVDRECTHSGWIDSGGKVRPELFE